MYDRRTPWEAFLVDPNPSSWILVELVLYQFRADFLWLVVLFTGMNRLVAFMEDGGGGRRSTSSMTMTDDARLEGRWWLWAFVACVTG